MTAPRMEAWAIALFGAALCLVGAASGKVHAESVRVSQPVAGVSARDASAFAPDALHAGMAQAPELIAKAGLACDPIEAVDLGDSEMADRVGDSPSPGHLTEIACRDDLGYLILTRTGQPPLVRDCVFALEAKPTRCQLDTNRRPALGLRRYLASAGSPCQPWAARALGHNPITMARGFEVACSGDDGVLLEIPKLDGSEPKARAVDCLALGDNCRFTPHRVSVAVLAAKIGGSLANTCDIGDARYIRPGALSRSEIVEVACRAGQEGRLIEIQGNGAVTSVRPCSALKPGAPACTLKPLDVIDPMITKAQATGVAPRPSVITNPQWLRRPDGADLARVYPDRAQRMGVSGEALISCRVSATGKLEACAVVEETPTDFGFGAAAISLAQTFQMSPMTRDGQPVGGARVTIPIHFTLSH